MQNESATVQKAVGAKAAIAMFIAAYALFGDNVVGIVVIIAAATGLVHPLILWSISAACVALINVACCQWVVRERSAFSEGPGGRVEKRLEGLRTGRMRRPIAWMSEGGARRFALAAGLLHSAAITVDQQVRAWGWNAVGQLGDGTTVDRHTPVSTVGPLAAGAIAAGAHHTLVLSP